MRFCSIVAMAMVFSGMLGCERQQSAESESAPSPEPASAQAPSPTTDLAPDSNAEPVPLPPQAVGSAPESAPKPIAAEAAGTEKAPVSSRDAALELARRSGCLACHSIEKKVVGPAWQDVAARYRGDPAARAALISKVSNGGKGNWTEVTGGMLMPPYGPRVAATDIERLVDFVLSLHP